MKLVDELKRYLVTSRLPVGRLTDLSSAGA
jgi:hypothetical protein